MKIMLVGGGSGGHLTPLIAVARSLKAKDSGVQVIHVGQKNENLQQVVSDSSIDETYGITAGKFRRYNGESFLSHLLDVKTVALNTRDFFRFIRGVGQAWRLLGRVRPDSIMLKGGFVCVPVGYAARLRGIPYITHDSDAVPGLANRLTAKHARYNTTALPADLYPYPPEKARQVGIPLRPEFTKVSATDKKKARKQLDIPENVPVILSVGGGLGAQKVNTALVRASSQLLADNPQLIILHLTGKKLYDETVEAYKEKLKETKQSSVRVVDFTTDIHAYSAAADMVITRAGATNIAEFALQAKPCVVIPNPVLTGGQQLHNARVLRDNNAAIILDESQLETLGDTVSGLLKDTTQQKALSRAIHKLSDGDSAAKLASILMEVGKRT